MIDVTILTKTLAEHLANHPNMQDFKEVVRSKEVNEIMSNTPWAGVYRKDGTYLPHTISRTRNWAGAITLVVLVQVSSMRDGEDAEDAMEEQLKNVLDAIMEDKTLKGNADSLSRVNVQYQFRDSESEDFIWQQAQIELTYEVRANG